MKLVLLLVYWRCPYAGRQSHSLLCGWGGLNTVGRLAVLVPSFAFGLLALPLCGRQSLSLLCGWGGLNTVERLAILVRSFAFGLLALPLCGAAVTFFAAAKKVTKESSRSAQRAPRWPHVTRAEWNST
jgi:hypothetical protein